MNDRNLLKLLLEDLKPAKAFLYVGLCLYIPVTLLSTIQPIIIGYGVQQAIANGMAGVSKYALSFLLVVVSLAFFELVQGYCLQVTGQRLVAHLRQRAFAKVQRLSMGFLDTTPLGKLLTRMTNDTDAVAEMFSMGAVQILADSLFLIGTMVMLFFVDIKLSLYSASILPLLAIGIYFFRLWTKRAFVQVRSVLSGLNSFLQEYLSAMPTVQMANRVKTIQEDFDRHNEAYLVANRRAVFLEAAIYSFIDAMSYVASALVLWGAFNIKLEGALTLGILVAFLEALSRFFQPLREISNRYAIFQSALVSLGRIYELFTWPEEHCPKEAHQSNFRQSIEFRNVSFAYQNGKEILKDISFTVKKGEHIALVGPSGAGKSTVIKLLSRFYPVVRGAIFIDGHNVSEMSLGESRKLVSVVPQEVFLFKGTLAENLRFGSDKASDMELWQALRSVQLEDLIKEKGGLYINVESKGRNFSVGERQLLAFARTLLVNPPILILDEATASVDVRTEQRLQTATKHLLQGRTALIIAHRLSTIIDADRILVFKHGEIVEEGTHDALLQASGVYAGLSRLHFQRGS